MVISSVTLGKLFKLSEPLFCHALVEDNNVVFMVLEN